MIEITTTFRGVPVSVRGADRSEFPDAMSATVEDIEIAFHEGGAHAMPSGLDLRGPEMLALVQELLAAYVRRGGDA